MVPATKLADYYQPSLTGLNRITPSFSNFRQQRSRIVMTGDTLLFPGKYAKHQPIFFETCSL